MPRSLVACLLLVVAVRATAAQDPAARTTTSRNLRVFFDCSARCDQNYIRTETPWVEFVRDRTDADVHLLITSLRSVAGGEEYTFNFVGLSAFVGKNDTLRFALQPSSTEDERRRGVTRTIQLGLGPFVARTPVASRLRVSLEDADEDEEARPATGARDPWRNWVFELEANASLEEEQRQSEFRWGGSLEAVRVTDRWKFGAQFGMDQDETRFTVEQDSGPPNEIRNLRESFQAGLVAVRSHGSHWASGFQVRVSSSTFSNTEFALRAAPAIEYSFFPYDEFTRRQLTLQYSAGASSFRYREVTIFGRLQETRPTHSLVLGYDVNQRWGSADVTFETARYFDNSKQWRLELDGELDVRITRGLSIEIGARASLIRDQLGIAARDATPEEVLLELRDLQTDYRYDIFVGINYTFGSIFSTVVNPRFGTGPGFILR